MELRIKLFRIGLVLFYLVYSNGLWYIKIPIPFQRTNSRLIQKYFNRIQLIFTFIWTLVEFFLLYKFRSKTGMEPKHYKRSNRGSKHRINWNVVVNKKAQIYLQYTLLISSLIQIFSWFICFYMIKTNSGISNVFVQAPSTAPAGIPPAKV